MIACSWITNILVFLMFMSLNRDLYILGVFHKLELGGAFISTWIIRVTFHFLSLNPFQRVRRFSTRIHQPAIFCQWLNQLRTIFDSVYLGNFILNSLKSICEHDTKPEPCFLPCDTFLLLSTYLWKCFLYNKQPRIMSYFQNKMLLSTNSCTLF